MGSTSHESHFKKIQNFKADYADAEFTQYESQRTGQRIVVVDRKGPKLHGYFAVATEIHDDSGSRKSEHEPAEMQLTRHSTHP
jgi:Zn-dependent M16 (insulinase) family peptidase